MIFPIIKEKKLSVMLECAGNKRGKFRPKVYGEQWEEGAISQAIWKGVELRYLLELTQVNLNAKEIVFQGRDKGERDDMEGTFAYERSLPLEKALHPDTLIAYKLNGKPIPYQHGFPFRLIVPQWYAMSSVKWLQKITVINHQFQGPFQVKDYVYFPEKDSDKGKRPVTTININSIIQQPLDQSILKRGLHIIKGIAYTGCGKVAKVEISFDGGKIWKSVKIKDNNNRYTWINWSYPWEIDQKGEFTIKVRATDSKGRTQKEEPFWNRKGYGYNAIQTINVKVE
ncbi:sulfite oxidase [Anaerobacillus sp. MEB173]|uniref:sulfite oxidase n=1 Tax=Anaerobacillus sp. MEB173 TaxID=3383345 RepID=UPI003F8F1962